MAAANVNWSQEEAEVQRILGNLRGNQPEDPIVAAGGARANPWAHAPPHIFGGDLGRGAPINGAPDALQMKKGIIDQTFEDLKLITDIDLAKLVL
jgi:hypothetical protein